MMKTVALTALTALTMGFSATTAFASDPAAGEAAFRGCRSCHGITSDDGTVIQRGGRTGPNLYGIAGRAIASVEGFNYSEPLTRLGATGAIWTEDLFEEYMADTTAFLRHQLGDDSVRSAMNFRLNSGADDMYAYLESLVPAQ